jgi:hypothetical protein
VNFVTTLWTRVSPSVSSGIDHATAGVLTYADGTASEIVFPAESSYRQYDPIYAPERSILGIYIPSYRPIYGSPQRSSKRDHVRDERPSRVFEDYSDAVKASFGIQHLRSDATPLEILNSALARWGNPRTFVYRRDLFGQFEAVLRVVLPPRLGFSKLTVRGRDVILNCNTGTFTLDAVSGGIAAVVDMAWQLFLYSKKVEGRSFVALVDEPENHLHPEMQRTVLPNFVRAFPNVQFIVATHAPLIVSSVRNARVYVLRYIKAADSGDLGLLEIDTVPNERIVRSIELNHFEKGGTANDVLTEVLGLDYTMPVWAAEILDDAVHEVARAGYTRDALWKMEQTLNENDLGQYLPGTLNRLTGTDESGRTPLQ